MSAAARGAAGYLYASGKLNRSKADREKFRTERAAVLLRREREAKSKQSNFNRAEGPKRR